MYQTTTMKMTQKMIMLMQNTCVHLYAHTLLDFVSSQQTTKYVIT